MKNLDKKCRVCVEWQEHCYWSHMADEEKHFFKVVAGDFTESISLPSRFANNFNGHISEVVTLKSPSGKTWSIRVGSDDGDEVVFRSGWNEFVGEQRVEEGDCLLFKYTGASAFDVLVFDASGYEKKTPPCVSQIRGYQQEEDGGDAQLEREAAVHKNTGRSNASTTNLPDEQDGWGWRACEVKEEDEDDVEILDGDGGAPATAAGYYFGNFGPVSEYRLTEEDREQIWSVRVPVRPRNPVFVQVMHPSHVRGKKRGIVILSAEFATKFMGTLRREIILRRSSGGGAWHARYICNRFARGLCGRGWCSFTEDNGVVERDVCLFEVMQGARRPTMTVHVLRKVRGRYVPLS